MNTKLKAARERRAESFAALERAHEAITKARPDEREALEAAFTQAEADHERAVKLCEQVETIDEARRGLRVAPDAGSSPRVSIGNEPMTYQRGGAHSFFSDLYARDINHSAKAAERLSRHMDEVRVERPMMFDLSSTDSAGGHLVAPLYLNDAFVNIARAGRVTANVIGPRPLPPNTDSINIPKASTGTTVADQADNAAVSETDMTFGTIAADVKTKAGMQDASMQLVDRSVPGIDEVIFADLLGAYGITVDQMVLSSSTANNLGLLDSGLGGNAITYTDASPTVGELYPKFADAIQQVSTNTFLPPDVILMHPRRWAFISAAVDSQGRPLVLPGMAQNPFAVLKDWTGEPVAEGYTGYTIQGLPVYTDPNIPTNLGAGTNEDRIIVARRDQLWLWEDPAGPYMETFRDVLSGTGGVRFRLHNYVAQCNVRRPKATSVIAGTGLVTPTL